MDVGVSSFDFHDCGVVHVVVVVVGDDYRVDDGDVFDLAWDFGVAFWAKPGEGAATLAKDGVEEDSKAGGEFDEVARVA